jgi:ferredoxin-thioredoxin reductase catalytic subunit
LKNLDQVKQRAESDAKTYGYYLNPDSSMLQTLLAGLKKNEERYGYPACPCRLTSGTFEFDRDIICPCDYRDPDIMEYGYCYCALYVRKDTYDNNSFIKPIPERRPEEKQTRAYGIPVESSPITIPSKGDKSEISTVADKNSKILRKLWYCKQCGYTAFREDPPYICPICKARREIFSEIELKIKIDT